MCTRASLPVSIALSYIKASCLPVSSASTMSSQTSVPPDLTTSMYAASVNPPRKAKLQAAASLLPALLPSPPSSESSSSTFSVSNVVPSPDSVQPRQKRGRKPAAGGSSRAAREAARKANHSRIEKARRGKINDALQELKRLVPPEFAPPKENDGEDDDEEGQHFRLNYSLITEVYCCSTDALFTPTDPSKKDTGKKAASEREFKLDILERTVIFVRALLKRVDEIERQEDSEFSKQGSSGCSCQCHCSSAEQNPKKRKVTEPEETLKVKKRRALSHEIEEQDQRSDVDEDDSETASCVDSDDDNDPTEEVEAATSPNGHANRVRLPSISELLSSPIEIIPSQAHVQQLPSPSLSPQVFPNYYSHQSRFASNLPSPIPPQTTLPAYPEDESVSCPRKARDCPTDPRASYPIGMSYLLTPPSPNTSSARTPHAHTPAFRLPSSALETREVSEERAMRPALEDELGAEGDQDGGARTATIALLQMRRSSFTSNSRSAQIFAARKEKTGDESAAAARTSLTPGGILGIQTNV